MTNSNTTVTKNDLKTLEKNILNQSRTMVTEAVDAIINGMDKIAAGQQVQINELRTDLKHVKETTDQTKTELSFVKDDIKGIKAELGNTPSRTEFEMLKKLLVKYN